MEETKVLHKKKVLAPKLRFNGFNESWENAKLGDVGKIRMCKRIFSHETKGTGEIPFYKIGTFGKEPDAFITKELYLDFRERFSFPKVGDILMSASGTIGRTVIYDGRPAYFQDSNIVWLDNDEKFITNSFLYYIYQIVKYNSEGGTIRRLYNSIISNTQFTKPPLPEQKKIVGFLSAVDEKIQLLNRKKQLLEQYKKGIMQQLFATKLRFKSENGKAYPNWQEKRLGDMLQINATYGVVTAGEFRNEGVKMVRGGDIKNGKISEHSPFISLKKAEEYKRTKLKRNDIVIALVGYPGEAAIVPIDLEGHNISRAVGLLRLNPDIDAKYVVQYLNSPIGRRVVLKPSAGSAQQVVNLKDLNNLIIPYPTLKEQQSIAEFLDSISNQIENISNQIIKTETFKKGLLQQMFV